jgi:hypothetical protein
MDEKRENRLPDCTTGTLVMFDVVSRERPNYVLGSYQWEESAKARIAEAEYPDDWMVISR